MQVSRANFRCVFLVYVCHGPNPNTKSMSRISFFFHVFSSGSQGEMNEGKRPGGSVRIPTGRVLNAFYCLLWALRTWKARLLAAQRYTDLFLGLWFNAASLFSFLQSDTTPRVASASNSRLDTSSSSPDVIISVIKTVPIVECSGCLTPPRNKM